MGSLNVTLPPSALRGADELAAALARDEDTLQEELDVVHANAAAALETLASESSVSRERALLNRIKETRLEIDATDMLSAGRIGLSESAEAEDETTASEDTLLPRVKKHLDRMLEQLEDELEDVDKSIGDKLRVLDKDQDGIVTAEEVYDAIHNILRNNNPDEAAKSIIELLDQDKDGQGNDIFVLPIFVS